MKNHIRRLGRGSLRGLQGGEAEGCGTQDLHILRYVRAPCFIHVELLWSFDSFTLLFDSVGFLFFLHYNVPCYITSYLLSFVNVTAFYLTTSLQPLSGVFVRLQ